MWSKRLMKQQVVCHLCGNNYMEMAFTGQCVAPEQPALNRRRRSDWQRVEIDCPEWFAFPFPSQACHQPGPRPYLRARLAFLCERLGEQRFSRTSPRQESVNLNREMSFSDLLGFTALRFFIRRWLSEDSRSPKRLCFLFLSFFFFNGFKSQAKLVCVNPSLLKEQNPSKVGLNQRQDRIGLFNFMKNKENYKTRCRYWKQDVNKMSCRRILYQMALVLSVTSFIFYRNG